MSWRCLWLKPTVRCGLGERGARLSQECKTRHTRTLLSYVGRKWRHAVRGKSRLAGPRAALQAPRALALQAGRGCLRAISNGHAMEPEQEREIRFEFPSRSHSAARMQRGCRTTGELRKQTRRGWQKATMRLSCGHTRPTFVVATRAKADGQNYPRGLLPHKGERRVASSISAISPPRDGERRTRQVI